MEELIKFVRTYRLSAGLAEQQRLANEIYALINRDLRFFVFAAITSPAAQDVMQEILKEVFTGLEKFEGRSNEEFWGWCYSIARNKVSDHIRKKSGDRLQPMADEQFHELVELSERAGMVSAAVKMDLDDAMEALSKSKPECQDYLWKYFVLGFDYAEIADQHNLSYDNTRMKIGRCLDSAQSLVS